MKWYSVEAVNQSASDHNEAVKKAVIQQSDWWAKLRRQVEEDVDGINNPQGFWALRMGRFPLKVQDHHDGTSAYVVRKELVPGLLITLRLLDVYVVEITHERYDDPKAPTKTTERLTVDSNGRDVYLITKKGNHYSVPEAAARYILMPVIDSLKKAKPLSRV